MSREQLPFHPAFDADVYDTALDRLVDTRGISYDDARRELGEPPYELYAVPEPAAAVASRALKMSSVRRRRRRRSGHGPQYGEEEGVGYPGGEPHYYQPYMPLTEEQAARNTGWIDTIRHDLHKPHGDDLKE